MPKPRNELFIRKNLVVVTDLLMAKLKNQIQENEDRIKKDGPKAKLITGVSGVVNCLTRLRQLKEMDVMLFGEDGNVVPDDFLLSEYANHCRACLQDFYNLKDYLTNPEVKDDVVRSVCKEITENYADIISVEIKQNLKTKKKVHDWGLSDDEKKKADDFIDSCRSKIDDKIKERIKDSFEKKGRDVDSRWVEFPDKSEDEREGKGFDCKLSHDLQLTGDVNDLAAYYVKNEGKLSKDTENYLTRRIGTLLYFDELEKQYKSKPSEPVFKVQGEDSDVNYKLEGYEGKYQYQTTNNGCWSCAYAMLLESRGISLNQQLIRMFRPDKSVDDLSGIDEKGVAGVLEDAKFSPIEMGDLTLKLLPTSGLRQVGIRDYGPGDYDVLEEKVKKYVEEAIKVHKSPIALNYGGHYRTIVGVEGDKLKVLDSLGVKEGLEDTISIRDIFDNKYNTFTLSWLQDLKFNRKGQCTNIPETHKDVHYIDGKLVNKGDDSDPFAENGDAVSAYSNYKGVTFSDSMYLPSEVPEAMFNAKIEKENVANDKQEEKQDAKKDEALNVKVTEEKQEEKQEEKKEEVPNVKVTGEKQEEKKIDPKIKETEEKKNASQVDPKENPDGARIRRSISDEITRAHKQIIKVVREWERMLDPYEALKFSVATMLVKSTLLESFDKATDVAKQQELDKANNNVHAVNDMVKSKEFNVFYSSIRTVEILRLCECPTENFKAVEINFHRMFVGTAPISQEKKASAPAAEINKSKENAKADVSKAELELKKKGWVIMGN